MSGGDEDYVFDEDSGEWMPASELAAKQAAANSVEVRDAVGNLLQDGTAITAADELRLQRCSLSLNTPHACQQPGLVSQGMCHLQDS